MKESVTIAFRDADSADEAAAIIRYDATRVALCLSLKTNGDVEVVMNKPDAKQLIEALTKAVTDE